MKIFFTFILFFVAKASFGMTPKEVIAAMQKVYKSTSSFEYDCTYKLFKGHAENVVTDAYSGYVCRNKSNYYQKIGPSEFIYSQDFFIKVSHAEKAMLLDLPQQSMSVTADLDKALEHCREIKMEETENYYQVVLLIKQTSSIPYSVIKFRVDKSKYHLIRMDLYYSDLQDFSENGKPDMAQPHLQIAFTKLNINPKLSKGMFDLGTYLSKTNNILNPVGNYKGYELIDKRIK